MPDRPFLGLQNAGIQADPEPMLEFRKNHPWISKAADFFSAGATDPNHTPSLLDLAAVALPAVGGMGARLAERGAIRGLEEAAPAARAPFMDPTKQFHQTRPIRDLVSSGDAMDRAYEMERASREFGERFGPEAERARWDVGQAANQGRFHGVEQVFPTPPQLQFAPDRDQVLELARGLDRRLAQIPTGTRGR